MKKYFTLVVLLCGVYFLGESSAHAEATERTKEEIFQNWYTNYLHSFVGDPYEEKPSVNAPYATGSLKQEFLEEGLKAANFSRYLVGLPDDLELDPILVNRAQHGAVVLAANKWITHSPSKPEGMSDEFYQEAKRSTHTSNLGPGDSLSYAVNQFMYDGHSNNYATVGHRKWILNPSLKKIGFGYANSFIAMQVFDTSRVKKVNYNYVAYPSNGYFPIEYMVQSNIPWSIFLNPSIYAPTSPSGVKVTLTRLNDNKVWTFDYTDYKDAPEGKFFAYSAMNGYGSGDSIIFRPPVAAYQAGDSYQVKVTGLQDWTGKYRSIEYKVDFFNLVQSLDINITKPIRVGEEIPYNIVMKTYNGETIDVTQKIPLKISSFDYEEQMMNGTMKVSGPLHGKVTLQACIVTTCVTSEPPYDEEGYINIETIGDSSKTIKGKTIPNFEVEIRTREYLYGPDRIVASGKANHIGEFDIKIPKLRVDQIVVVVLKNSEGKEIEQVIKTVIDNAPSTPPLPDNDDIRIIDDEKKVWTIAFNMAVDEDSVNNETIRVTDSKGEFFEVHVNVKDETTVQVTPVNHYIQGERYTLIITKNVRSKNSKPLMEAVKLDFMLEDAAPISCDSNFDEVVHIPDENLEKQIRDVTSKASREHYSCRHV